MQYRVMSYDGEVRDFEAEAEARAFYLAKKVIAEKAPIPVDPMKVRLFAHIHRCYHRPDGTSDRACEIIEEYRR